MKRLAGAISPVQTEWSAGYHGCRPPDVAGCPSPCSIVVQDSSYKTAIVWRRLAVAWWMLAFSTAIEFTSWWSIHVRAFTSKHEVISAVAILVQNLFIRNNVHSCSCSSIANSCRSIYSRSASPPCLLFYWSKMVLMSCPSAHNSLSNVQLQSCAISLFYLRFAITACILVSIFMNLNINLIKVHVPLVPLYIK
jgi:hypothetical protein